MLKHTRVSRLMDIGRLGQAVSYPGIDTRVWCSLAVVNEVVVDAAEGVFADITLLPSGDEETARVAQGYAGGGFGAYFPIQKDDEVLVVAPSGDPNEGLVIVDRLYSAADKPPPQAVAHPEDLAIIVKPGQSIRIIVENGGKVYLGGDDGEPATLADTLAGYLDAIKGVFNGHKHTGGTLGGGLTGAPDGAAFASVPDIAADKVVVK